MDPLATARRYGIERGLFGNSRLWLVLGVIAWAIRGFLWAWRPAPTKVFSGNLTEGETLTITQLPPVPSRRKRRRAARRLRRQV
ncbi:MAG: hypothetical protein F2520_05300 [Actinobacteria bacterium]|uniref:Unannotated protein n=1 Tax=freshwater metagenome TaxID=449393 RepID=A0A6J7IQS8_9ZZZZ|nr:hypothetical protein [Actinomycetota bacterium]MTA77657.1 hypothetical protein [Actinomycetota bacterium]